MLCIMPLSMPSDTLSQCILFSLITLSNCCFLTVRPTSEVLWKSVTPPEALCYTFSIHFRDLIVISQCSSFPASSPTELERQCRCILNCLGFTFRLSPFPLLNFSTAGILHEFPGLLTSGINYSPDTYSF